MKVPHPPVADPAIGAVLPGGPAQAEDAGDLARAVLKPAADLVSQPLRNDTNVNDGLRNSAQNLVNIQPALPFAISENWNIITRPSHCRRPIFPRKGSA